MKSKSNLFVGSIAIYIISIQVLSLLFNLGTLMIIYYDLHDILLLGSALLWLLLTVPVVRFLCFFNEVYGKRNVVLYLFCFIAFVMYLGGRRLTCYLTEGMFSDSTMSFRILWNEDLKFITSVVLTIGIVVYRNYLFKAEVIDKD